MWHKRNSSKRRLTEEEEREHITERHSKIVDELNERFKMEVEEESKLGYKV